MSCGSAFASCAHGFGYPAMHARHQIGSKRTKADSSLANSEAASPPAVKLLRHGRRSACNRIRHATGQQGNGCSCLAITS